MLKLSSTAVFMLATKVILLLVLGATHDAVCHAQNTFPVPGNPPRVHRPHESPLHNRPPKGQTNAPTLTPSAVPSSHPSDSRGSQPPALFSPPRGSPHESAPDHRPRSQPFVKSTIAPVATPPGTSPVPTEPTYKPHNNPRAPHPRPTPLPAPTPIPVQSSRRRRA